MVIQTAIQQAIPMLIQTVIQQVIPVVAPKAMPAHSSTTVFLRIPTFEISTSTTSPAFIQSGG